MDNKVTIQMNNDVTRRFAAHLFCGLVLLSVLPAAFASAANRREIVEEAFAAYAKNTIADRKSESAACTVEFAPRKARLVRLVIRRTNGGQACLDELEVYGPNSTTNLALAKRGAVARAVICPPRLCHSCRASPERRTVWERS